MDQLYQDQALVEVYDALNASRDDFDFYLARFPKPPCTVLDIGCGTGTFALDLAKRGYTVTAVDPAPAMIAAARGKPGADAVQWVTGTADDLPLQPAFEMAVMTGHAFQCLLTDDDIGSLFQSVSERLADGGSFWFETRNAHVKPWENWTPERAGPAKTLPNGTRVRVVQRVLAVDGEYVTFEETYHINGHSSPLISRSTLRFAPMAKIETLAETCGLRVGVLCGDWTGGAFVRTSPEIIIRLDQAA